MITVNVRNLKKMYKLYHSPAHRLKEIILRRPFHTEFTALNNVTFSVIKGETFGIIGENGAGKSTLLKILSKTLKPTTGEVMINGRTSALLELGAGFNPELTGEENIYLNGYLTGMTKGEIESKKQEIIDFSELGDFIGRPVKTYSSGMYVRLAFSIATSVEPEILIVDEALSVGDEYFQKKCIDRMMDLKKSGKTILFCSHSMYHIQELCNRVMWLHHGEIRGIGETGKIIVDYQNFERGKTAALKDKIADVVEDSPDNQDKPVRIVDVRILDKDGNETETLRTFEPVTFSFRVRCKRQGIKGHFGFAIIRNDEVMTFGTMTSFDGLSAIEIKDGQELRIELDSLPLLSGLYSVALFISDEYGLHPYDLIRSPNFSLINTNKEFGMTYIAHKWSVNGKKF